MTKITKNSSLLYLIMVFIHLFIFNSCTRKPAGMKINPENDQEIAETEKLIRSGDLDKALAILNRLESSTPDSRVYLYRAIIRQKMVDFKDAVDDYEKAARLDPENPLIFALLGRQLILMGDIDRAKAELETALKLDPHNPEALMGKGMIDMFFEDYGKALDFFEEIIASLPDHDDPKYADLFQERGYAYYYHEEYEDALKDFEHAIEIDPNSFYINVSYVGKALCLYRLGHPEEAFEVLNKVKNVCEVLSLHAEYDPLIQIYFAKGDLDRAVQLAGYAYKAFPGLYPDVRRQAQFLEYYGNLKESEELFQKAFSMDPQGADAYLRYGYKLMALGDIEEAQKYYKKGADADPTDFSAQLESIDFHLKTRQTQYAEKALNALEKYIDKVEQEERARFFREKATLKMLKGNYDEAQVYINKSLETQPDDLNCVLINAEISAKQGLYDKALSLLLEKEDLIWTMEDDQNLFLLKKAEYLIGLNRIDEGLETLTSAFEREYPSQKLFWFQHRIPQSDIFQKHDSEDSPVYKLLLQEKNNIIDVYKQNNGGKTPKELEKFAERDLLESPISQITQTQQ